MNFLLRFTSEYVASEDRFRLNSVTKDQSELALWVTQRVLVRLIRFFANWLDKTSPEVNKSTAIDSTERTRLQKIVQQSARSEITRSKPIAVQSDSDSWLVSRIDIKANEKGARLTFKSEDGQTAELVMTIKHLRQWLSIVHSLWRTAEWPMDVWPEWIEAAQSGESDSESPVH